MMEGKKISMTGKGIKKIIPAIIVAIAMCMQPVFAMAASVEGQKADSQKTTVKMYWDSEFNHKTLKKKEKFSLKKILRPKGLKVKYTSKRKSIAKVTKAGMVKALKKGNANIEVMNKKTKEKITYYIHVGTKVKSVKWKNAKKTKDIYLGKTFDLNTQCTPAKAAYKKVLYKTSNKKILKVTKKGILKPVKNGTATITATAADQSGKKVKCKVTVKTRATKITLAAERDMGFVNESLKITPTVMPETTTDKTVKWTSSDTAIATVSKYGNVKGVSSGTVTITATAKDGSGKKASYTVNIVDQLDPSKMWFTAHRGYSGKYPENTLQSYAAAVAQGYSGIETDIWENNTFYSDEEAEQEGKTNPEFVIMHDATLKRMCGKSDNVSALTSQNLADYPITGGNGNDPATTYKIPLLEEYIDQVSSSGKTLVIEMKDKDISDAAVTKLLNLLDSKGVSSRTHIISFEKQSLLNVKAKLGKRKDIKLVRLLGARDKGNFEDEIDWCADNGMNEVSISDDYLTDDYIQTIKDYGMLVGVWVVDDRFKAADFLRRGCDHVTTNTVMW